MQNGPSNTEAFSAQICTQNVPKSSMADSASPPTGQGRRKGEIFWKRVNRFLCKLEPVIREARAWNDQLLDQHMSKIKLHEVEIGHKNPYGKLSQI